MDGLTVTIPYSVRISKELLDEMRRLYDRMEPPKPTFSAVLSHIVKLDGIRTRLRRTARRVFRKSLSQRTLREYTTKPSSARVSFAVF